MIEETRKVENCSRFLGKFLETWKKVGSVFGKLLINLKELVQSRKLWATLHTILWTWLCLVPPGYTSSRLASRHLSKGPPVLVCTILNGLSKVCSPRFTFDGLVLGGPPDLLPTLACRLLLATGKSGYNLPLQQPGLGTQMHHRRYRVAWV